jgi:transcriptional regulator with XRE-family HTH domain
VGALASLRQHRRRSGLTQRQLATAAGVTPVTVCRVESGRERPNARTIARLANALGVDPRELTDHAEARPPLIRRRFPRRVSAPTVAVWRDLVDLPNLRAARIDADLSYAQLETLSCVHAHTITAIEAGAVTARIATARRLANALGKRVSDLMDLGSNGSPVRLARYRAGMSIVDLHLRSGVGRKTILLTERGRHARPETLVKLAAALDVDAQTLLGTDRASTGELAQCWR